MANKAFNYYLERLMFKSINITAKELEQKLKEHKLWLKSNGVKGTQLNLHNHYLLGNKHQNVLNKYKNYLSKANMKDTIFIGIILKNADLHETNLSDSYIFNSMLLGCNMHKCMFVNACICESSLNYSILEDCDFSAATINSSSCVKVQVQNIFYDRDTYLDDCHLTQICSTSRIPVFKDRLGTILKEPMIGYKKCRDNTIVTLEIPAGAVVFSINGKKCRTNIAKCVDIEFRQDRLNRLHGISKHRRDMRGRVAFSEHDHNFSYRIGQTYTIDDFDLRYNVECTNGIHFFKTYEEAMEYFY